MFIVTVVLNLNLNSKPRPQSLYCTLKHLNGVWVPRKGIMQKMWHYPLLAHSNEKSFQITMTAVHLLVLLLFLLFLHRGASDKKKNTHITPILELFSFQHFFIIIILRRLYCWCCSRLFSYTSSTSVPLYLQRKLFHVTHKINVMNLYPYPNQ